MSPRHSPFRNESVLTDRLRQRDEQAFRWLYAHYSVTLHLHLLPLVPNREQADDLLQDVFIKLWQGVDRYDPAKGRLYTWMRNVAQNTAIDAIRAGKARHRPAAHQVLAIGEETMHTIDRQRWVNAANPDHIGLRDCVARLRPDHRQLIELIYFGGYTRREASDVLGIPVGTLKTRLRVALRALKRLF